MEEDMKSVEKDVDDKMTITSDELDDAAGGGSSGRNKYEEKKEILIDNEIKISSVLFI